MIILRHAKFISGSRIYKVGETLPDTAGVRELVNLGFAEVVNPEKTVKDSRSKKEQAQPVQPSQPLENSQSVQGTQSNDQGNS